MKEKPSIRDAVNKIPEQEKLEIAKVSKTKHVRTFLYFIVLYSYFIVLFSCKHVSEVWNDRTSLCHQIVRKRSFQVPPNHQP